MALELGVLEIEVVVLDSGSGMEHERVERGKRYDEDEDEEDDGNLNFRMWSGKVFVRFEMVPISRFESETALSSVCMAAKWKNM